jgi:hypothetical protein
MSVMGRKPAFAFAFQLQLTVPGVRVRPMTAAEPFEARACHLRRLYHQVGERDQGRVVIGEYERLFPDCNVRLDQVLVSAWIEGRQLAGWQYDMPGQGWRRAEGSAVVDDDGREWAHL